MNGTYIERMKRFLAYSWLIDMDREKTKDSLADFSELTCLCFTPIVGRCGNNRKSSKRLLCSRGEKMLKMVKNRQQT
jgi:hypothetical protein